MAQRPGLLFTAFEPSGDTLAAAVAAQVRRLEPDLPLWAMGGPLLRDAGVQIIEQTTEHAVMLAGAAGKAMEHRRRLKRLRQWLREHPLAAVVPVDSPAANWSICETVRREQAQAKVVHLVAPQVWAWATWRVRKLKRLTDKVLCLLPFEADWLAEHGVPGVFVGHPLFETARRTAEADHGPALPDADGPKLALLPGSRAGEVRANWKTMLAAYRQLKQRHPSLRAVVAGASRRVVDLLRSIADPTPADEVSLEVGRTDKVLAWSDAVLVVSGTATLHVAAHARPMVVLYRLNRFAWHLVGRWVVRTRTFALPNLIAERAGMGRVVPEFVPHFGGPEDVVTPLETLLAGDSPEAARQRALFDHIQSIYAGLTFRERAASELLATVRR